VESKSGGEKLKKEVKGLKADRLKGLSNDGKDGEVQAKKELKKNNNKKNNKKGLKKKNKKKNNKKGLKKKNNKKNNNKGLKKKNNKKNNKKGLKKKNNKKNNKKKNKKGLKKKNNKQNKEKGLKKKKNNKKNKKNNKKTNKKNKKKTKKLSKKNKKKKNKNNKDTTCSNQVKGTCLQNAYDTIVFNRDKVTNFLNQITRIGRQLEVKEKKLNKKSEFTDAGNVLKDVLGKNTTNFTCGIKNKGAMLSNATEAYTILVACNTTIKTACTVNTTEYSAETETLHEKCNTTMITYNAKVVSCLKLTQKLTTDTTDSVCTCWSDAATQMAAIKALKCDAADSSNAVKKMKNECIKQMGVCKKSLQAIPAILFECQVDHDNADKSIDEIKTTNREVVPEIRDVSSL